MSTPPKHAQKSPERAEKSPLVKALALGGALVVVLTLMLLAFLTPAMHSGAKDLPLAVAGPQQATGPLVAALDQKAPGAFDVTTHDSTDRVLDAVRNRDAIGGITVDAKGVQIVLAGGAGAPYSTLLRQIGAGLSASGKQVTYTDVAPLTAKDPAGSAITALALPLAFGGMISAFMLSNLLKGHRWWRVGTSIGFSIAAGLVISAIMIHGYGAVEANYWEPATGLAMGIGATSLFVLGMESLFGYAGLGIGAVLTMFVSNPLSGIATGWQWLPHPWGAIGQFMPLGAAGTVLRSIAYFDGHGVTHGFLVLGCYLALGIVLVAISAVLKARRSRAVVA